MNPSQLDAFLLQNNQRPRSDWHQLIANDEPQSVNIQGQQVYVFDLHFNSIYDVPFEHHIVVSQQPPGTDIPFHMHPYSELIYVYRGQCTIALLHEHIVMREGDLILIDQQTPHTVSPTGINDIIIDVKLKRDYLSFRCLNRFTDTIAQFLVHALIDSRRVNRYLYFEAKPELPIHDTMIRILCEYFERDFCSAKLIDAYCFILFTELVRHSGTQPDSHHTTVLELLRYIREHYRDCSLIELAQQFDYHPNYVSALLKKETGYSFMDLLQMERLNKAALYLTNSDMPIPAIAEEVGYASASFFHKKFKERFGATPSSYRQQARD
ncbi:AraC family transcriptional regulator [Paenibacillus campi]|uniref:AraC family transcriptional regulator n=1 Tax=Paenibacillus campi TaxID=3106031 RepID=UPI002AFEEF82|nr:AraC family transcriptional regulator [Paenibacillus sp. SGZ-1009]